MRQPLTYGVRTEVLVTKPNQMLEEHAVLMSVFALRHMVELCVRYSFVAFEFISITLSSPLNLI